MSFDSTSNAEWFTSTRGVGGPLSFWRYQSGSPQYILHLTTSGRVGLNTNAPVSSFEVQNESSSFVGMTYSRKGASNGWGMGEQYDLIAESTSFRASYVRTLGCVQTLATTSQAEATGSFVIDCANAGTFATDTDSSNSTMVISPSKVTMNTTSLGIGNGNPLAKLDISTNVSSQFGMRLEAVPESYASVTSARSLYFKSGTVAWMGNSWTGRMDNSATLLDFGAYNATGNTNVYIGAVAGSGTNAAAHFVIGRRTDTSTWSETLRITEAGRLGVGCSPTSFIDFRNPGDPAVFIGGVNGSFGLDLAQVGGPGWYSGSAVAGDCVIRNGDSSKKLMLQAGTGSAVLTVTNARVGIMNASPVFPLDVVGTDLRLAQFKNTSDYSRILLNGMGGGDLIFQDNGTSKFGVACISGNLQFLINDSLSTIPLSLHASGNVSVGTATDMGARFVSARDITLVAGNYAGDVGAQLMAIGASNTNKRLALMYDTTNDIGLIQAMIYGTGPKSLILNAAGGNVGIGTTVPGTTLEVMNNTGSSNLPFLRLNNSLGGAGNQVGICLNPYSSRPGGDTSKIVAIDDGAASSALTFWTAPSGQEATTTSVERMRIMPNGHVGVATTNPQWAFDVNGVIARSGVRLPRFDNNNFSGASSVTIPVLFADTGYNYLEIKVRYVVSAICNINISAQDTNNSALGFRECALTTVRWNNQGVPVYTTFTDGATSGLFANDVETAGIDSNLIFRIVRATGSGSAGNRNHYSYDNTYCWASIGTTRGYGQGHVDNAYAGGPAVASITLTCSTGTMSGTYSTVHSY